MMQRLILLTLALMLQFSAFAQSGITSLPLASKDSAGSDWSFEASIYYYALPHESDNFMPEIYVDYKSIHFEARHNYEDIKSTSLFAGYRFETGSKFVAGFTPIAGLVFGNTQGFAPGLLMDLTYEKFDFYSESEYIFDNSGSENNFAYTWSELAFSPSKKIRTGLSANRTRVYQNDRYLQHGIFGEYIIGSVTAGLHYFNPLSDDYFIIGTLSIQL